MLYEQGLLYLLPQYWEILWFLTSTFHYSYLALMYFSLPLHPQNTISSFSLLHPRIVFTLFLVVGTGVAISATYVESCSCTEIVSSEYLHGNTLQVEGILIHARCFKMGQGQMPLFTRQAQCLEQLSEYDCIWYFYRHLPCVQTDPSQAQPKFANGTIGFSSER